MCSGYTLSYFVYLGTVKTAVGPCFPARLYRPRFIQGTGVAKSGLGAQLLASAPINHLSSDGIDSWPPCNTVY